MTVSDQLTDQITSLISETLMVDVPSPDTDLIETGLIDSLALVTLITEIEGEFGIQLPLDEFEIDEFRSAKRIATYVSSHLAESGAG